MIGIGSDCLSPIYIKTPGLEDCIPFNFLRVRCGHCPNCRKFQSLEWSLRVLMEYQGMKEKKACFVTLTYDDDHLTYIPFFYDGDNYVDVPTLNFDDLKKFFYKIRSYYHLHFRYFAVGEYGMLFDRPHFHMIYFGENKNNFIENVFQDCWIHGHVQVDEFSPATAFYSAGYVQKKLYSPRKKDDFLRICEQSRASLGLGWNWFLNEWKSGRCIGKNGQPCVHYHGFEYGVPRTFIRKLVDIGLLEKEDMRRLVFRQWVDYNNLVDDLKQKGLSMEDFFSYRKKVAFDKVKKSLSKRDKF